MMIRKSTSVVLFRLGRNGFRPISCGFADHVHFNATGKKHPLKPLTREEKYEKDIQEGDHTGRQQNHIWTKHEIEENMSHLYRHQPVTFSDKLMNKLMYGLYHTFNFVTGFRAENPSVKSIEWRLIVLESVAGVPGFVAAGFRHFHSLRTMSRDHGWISTLIEEAENERMHLILCLNTFQANWVTRMVVIGAQYVMVPFVMGVYLVHPRSLHRFVGYLEETACHTYVSIIKNVETPGTHLNTAWADTPAPPIAIGYYHLPRDAKWVDVLKCMMADECNHRDVNHTFADMDSDDPNPFLTKHRDNAAHAWRLNVAGEPTGKAPENDRK